MVSLLAVVVFSSVAHETPDGEVVLVGGRMMSISLALGSSAHFFSNSEKQIRKREGQM